LFLLKTFLSCSDLSGKKSMPPEVQQSCFFFSSVLLFTALEVLLALPSIYPSVSFLSFFKYFLCNFEQRSATKI